MAKKRDGAAGSSEYGLRKSSKYQHINWKLDVDYADRLSEAERQWLGRFLYEYYRSGSRKLMSQEQIREDWRAFKAGQRDLMSRSKPSGSSATLFQAGVTGGAEEDRQIRRLDLERDSVPATSRPTIKRRK